MTGYRREAAVLWHERYHALARHPLWVALAVAGLFLVMAAAFALEAWVVPAGMMCHAPGF